MPAFKPKPILKDLPVPISTQRLIIRPVQPNDGKIINALVLDSYKDLRRWMPWAKNRPTVDESEEYARYSAAKWLLREELPMLIFRKEDNALLGATGFHSVFWEIPKFEIGYWLGSKYTGKGYASEAVAGLTQYAFQILGARRLEIRMDEQNIRSKAIAERLGFSLESRMVNECISAQNPDELRNTLVYVRYELKGVA